MQQNCVFCRIISKELPATIVAQNDSLMVIKDLHPKAPIHYLIIPKKHIVNLVELDKNDVEIPTAMILMAQKLANDLPSQAFKLVANNGAAAGQVVFHLHFHFLAGDTIGQV